MATVGLSNISKAYGGARVIHGITMDIEDGELIVVVGPSGCGKSTLLRMIAGLEAVTGGEITIGGRVVNDLEPRERNIAMVFQNYALYPHMSVRANLAYGLKIAGMGRAEIQRRIERAAAMLQIEAYLDRKPRQLSGGQRQRVAMGRAIVREPAVFLFDEPLSNLDAKLRVQMRMEIKALQRELGVTAVYVTHDQVEAMTMADRMVVMNAGEAEQIGAPLDVYHHPATRFVAGFIGSPPMNFLPVELLAGGPATPPPGAVEFGIRPEYLDLCDPGDVFLTGELKFHEALGAENLLHVQLNHATQPRNRDTSNDHLVVVRQAGRNLNHEPGSRVGLTFPAEQLAFFDAGGRSLGV